ncbi:MAG: hypothetical protein HOB82_04110 [Alphaproteobacteria bacterium]|nr:hypothetical protein [Alphaproteobacteria bacterium]MBT5859868.1 hypothetical protein [Alphaproteobacteria bacterium]
MRFDFRDVPTVIADEDSTARQALQGYLKSMGFRSLEHVETADALGNRLAKSEVALLIGGATMADGQVLEMIRKIRRNEIAGQPFMPVVALVDEPEAVLVRSVIDSGVDLIFTQPLSQSSIEQGLKALIMRRRPFVVTYDYVGPDRRRDQREAEDLISLVEVPNALRRWAAGFSDDPPSKKILTTINQMRAQRQANQVLYLADLVIAHYSGGPKIDRVKSRLAELRAACIETKTLATPTKYRNQATLCDLADSAAAKIEAAVGDGQNPDVSDLVQLAAQIQVAFEINSASDTPVDA